MQTVRFITLPCLLVDLLPFDKNLIYCSEHNSMIVQSTDLKLHRWIDGNEENCSLFAELFPFENFYHKFCLEHNFRTSQDIDLKFDGKIDANDENLGMNDKATLAGVGGSGWQCVTSADVSRNCFFFSTGHLYVGSMPTDYEQLFHSVSRCYSFSLLCT